MRAAGNPLETALQSFALIRGMKKERDPFEDLRRESMELSNELTRAQLGQIGQIDPYEELRLESMELANEMTRNQIAQLLNPQFEAQSSYGKLMDDANRARAMGDESMAQQLEAMAEAELQRKAVIDAPTTIGVDAYGNPVVSVGGQQLMGQNVLDSALGGALEDPRKQGGIYIDPETGQRVVTPTRQEMSKLQESYNSGEQLINTIDHIIDLGGDPTNTLSGLISNTLGSFMNFLGVPTPFDATSKELFDMFKVEAADKYMKAKGLPNTAIVFEEILKIMEHPKGITKNIYLNKMNKLKEALQQDMSIIQDKMSKGFELPETQIGMSQNPLSQFDRQENAMNNYNVDDLLRFLQ